MMLANAELMATQDWIIHQAQGIKGTDKKGECRKRILLVAGRYDNRHLRRGLKRGGGLVRTQYGSATKAPEGKGPRAAPESNHSTEQPECHVGFCRGILRLPSENSTRCLPITVYTHVLYWALAGAFLNSEFTHARGNQNILGTGSRVVGA